MWDVFVNQSENRDSFATHSLLSLVSVDVVDANVVVVAIGICWW